MVHLKFMMIHCSRPITSPSQSKGKLFGETLKPRLDCQIPPLSPTLCKSSELSRLTNSLEFSAALSFNMWPVKQRWVTVKRILNYFCLTRWNNLYRKLSLGSVRAALITHQFRVHLSFLVTDWADFQEKNLASVPWKVVFGKMDFRNEHNDDLIIDGNVITQRAIASLFWGQTCFSFGELPKRQQESKPQLIYRGKMVWLGQDREQKLL